MEDQGQGESGNQAGNKGATVSRASTLFHFLHPRFVARIVAHLAHPRFCEKQGRVPQKTDHHGGYRGYQDRQPIQLMKVHGELLRMEKQRNRWGYPMTRRAGMQREIELNELRRAEQGRRARRLPQS